MITQIFLILFSAIVTSALTLTAGWYAYQHYLKERLMTDLDDRAEALGELLRERVREGVREGIHDGFAGLPSDLMGKATRGVTKTGMDIFEDSMKMWFGPPKSDKTRK